MNRFLTGATATALGLALCGTAQADGRHGHVSDERNPNPDCDSDGLRYLGPWRAPLDWNDWQYFDHWWVDPNDLRHFESWRADQHCFNNHR